MECPIPLFHNVKQMESIPAHIFALFTATSVVTLFFFFKAAHYSKTVIAVSCGLAVIHSLLSLNGFYTNGEAIPPRFIIAIAPGIILCVVLFFTSKGKGFIDSLDLKTVTILHSIRVPVEITLLNMFLAGLVPQSMTFEGSNFDILSGITAPVVWYLVFILKKGNTQFLLIWNVVCLGLLLNVVITAILSAKTPFQQFAFDQPNIGVGYFPFILLPAIIVPIVLFSHLAAIRILLNKKKQEKNSIKNLPV